MARTLDMTRGKPLHLMASFALPLMAGNVCQLLYSVADSAVVGRVLGVQAFAAVGAAGFYSWLVTDIVLGFSQGFGVVLTLPALIGTWGVHLAMPLGWAAAWILLNLSYYVIYRSRCRQTQ